MPPKAVASSARTAADCVPSSEEQVYLYSKSGTERIAELEEKRTGYEALDAALESLPRKLRHPGLIPLGPGLFARGALVRTNEILVLLGDSYFAERTSFQAREIVHRRLQVIDAHIAEVGVGKREVAVALSGASDDAVRSKAVPSVTDVTGKIMTSTRRKSEPISMDAAANSVGLNRPPRSPRPSVSTLTAGRGNSDGQSGKQKRVSFASGTKDGDANIVDENASGPKSAADTVREMLTNFNDSVERAEQISRESGTVNIVEEYDKHGVLQNVQAPEENRPENVIVTAEDEIEDLFDMTRPKKEGGEVGQKDFLKMLIQAEREEELEQAKIEAERAERVRRKEAKEFGGGFAKGFFGKNDKRSNASGVTPKGILKKKDVIPLESVVEDVEGEEIDATDKYVENETPLERQALGNVVLERSTGSRRPRRKAVAVKKTRVGIVNIAEMEEQGGGEGDEEEIVDERPQARISKFKQMRALQQR